MKLIHPTLIKDFIKTHTNKNLHLKYVNSKNYQYLLCKGNISQKLDNDIKKLFPECYVTNGNRVGQKNFRLNNIGV